MIIFRKTLLLLQLFIVGFVLFFSCSTNTNISAVRTSITQFAKQQAQNEGGNLYEKSLQIINGKLEANENTYWIAIYTIEGFAGGNNYQQKLAIFLNSSVRMTPLDSIIVSSKEKGQFDGLEIKNQKIVLSGKKLSPNDPLCCPSVSTSIEYQLKEGRLIYFRGEKLY